MIFFSKKYFIADMLEGLTDIHCHILPNLDDGAKDNSMALEMLREYINMGYSGVIATPHIMNGYYSNTAAKITKTFSEFQSFLSESGYQNFYFSAAAEYMLDDGFDTLTKIKEFLPIVSNQVLVEMSYLHPSLNIHEQLFKFQIAGYKPILAHPERYSYLDTVDKILLFKDKGCSLQLNLLSLGDHYGKRATHHAFSLLENGHYDYLGTDAHHLRHLLILKKISIPKKIVPQFEALVIRTKENLRNLKV